MYIEGAKQFVKVITLTGEIQTYQTLQDFEQRLPDEGFLRIHLSFIIAIDHIRAYNDTTVEVAKFQLPIGLPLSISVSVGHPFR